MVILARLLKEKWTTTVKTDLKLLRNITILSLALCGFWTNLAATAGDPPVTVDGTVVTSDTTEPASSVILLNDTTEPANPVVDAVLADSLGDETEPPTGNGTAIIRAPLESNEDIPAGELYEDFDTTIVHSEKFDALVFEDTVMIVLSGDGHCNYVHPFDGNSTSSFGFRSYRYHFGMDINLETGDSVKCCFDGKVRIAQRSKTYGYVVVIRHNNGLETYYAHLSKLMVKPGQDIEAGMVLGLGGNTGHSHGSHLHFEVRFKGQPIDPNYIIDFKNHTLRTDTVYLTKSNFKYLTQTYKVRHYSKKKKKTWYTYYTAGGAHYATPEAKRIMAAVPDPVIPGTSTTLNPSSSSNASPVNNANDAPKAPTAAPKKTTTATPAKTTTTTAAKTTPKPATTAAAKPAGNTTYYTIKKGDTLSGIAVKYGTTVSKLCQLNGLKTTSTLQIGQKVRVK